MFRQFKQYKFVSFHSEIQTNLYYNEFQAGKGVIFYDSHLESLFSYDFVKNITPFSMFFEFGKLSKLEKKGLIV